MSNPFDQVINIENPVESENIETGVKESPKKKDNLHISFSINKKMIERGIFSLIIIALAVLVFINPLCDSAKCSEEKNADLTGAVVLEQTNNSKINVSTSSQEKTPTTEAPKATEKTEADDEKQEETEKLFATNFDFSIQDVEYYKCSELNGDCDDDDKPVKIKSIKFLMRNRWKDFRPKIEAFWYDKNSEDIIKNKVRATVALPVIKEGDAKIATIDSFDSKFFDPSDNKETIELRIYNKENDMLMDTTTKVIG